MRNILNKLGILFLGTLVFLPKNVLAHATEQDGDYHYGGMMGGIHSVMGEWSTGGVGIFGWIMMILYFLITIAVLIVLILLITKLLNNKK